MVQLAPVRRRLLPVREKRERSDYCQRHARPEAAAFPGIIKYVIRLL
jgi:hypothetical protein